MRAGHTNVQEMGGWVQECGGCRTPKNTVGSTTPMYFHNYIILRVNKKYNDRKSVKPLYIIIIYYITYFISYSEESL